MEQALLRRLLRQAERFTSELEEDSLHVDAALERLLGLSLAGPASGQEKSLLRRGDICELDVAAVALPPGTTEPIDIRNISPTTAYFLNDVGAMLRDPADVAREEGLRARVVLREKSIEIEPLSS